MKGYMGKLLRVDLSHGRVVPQDLDPELTRLYLGGTGLGVRLLYNEVPPDVDSLSPANKVMITTGPLTASSFPTAGRFQVTTKSPLTGGAVDASSGGHWGANFKQTGYDAIVIEGKADKPVYLYINSEDAELRDASQYWGLDALEVQDRLRTDLGDKKCRVACIGPAGEKQVRLACLMNDEGRAAGRGGNGAVLGSKNLKAIVVNGNRKPEFADKASLDEASRKMMKGEWPINSGWAGTPVDGTASVLDGSWATGDIPVKNWSVGQWKEGALAISGKRMTETILTHRYACYRCPIHCGREVAIKDGPYKMEGPGPEYETLAAFGTMCLVDNLEAISFANDLCNRYGVDTISTGTTIAFAMEAYERGLIGPADTGGIALTWGNAEAMVAVTELIGKNEGIGQLLGQGMKRAAEQIGRGATDFANHVKGLEAPMHDPRCYHSLGVTYATSPRGACHLHGMSSSYEGEDVMPEWGLTGCKGTSFDPVEGIALVAKVAQDHAAVINSMVTCIFAPHYFPMKPSHFASFINWAAGTSYDAKELKAVGERIMALQRSYNYRCGLTAKDDALPKRALEPVKEGGSAGKVPDMNRLLADYYKIARLEKDGRPERSYLEGLGLEDVAEDLYG